MPKPYDSVKTEAAWRYLSELIDQNKRRREERVARLFLVGDAIFCVIAVGCFLTGVALGSPWIAILGGILLVSHDIVGVYAGPLKPTALVASAVVLALFVRPFYMGIFWASAFWHAIGVPEHIKLLVSKSAIARRLESMHAIQAIKGTYVRCPFCGAEGAVTKKDRGAFQMLWHRQGITTVECPQCTRRVRAEEYLLPRNE